MMYWTPQAYHCKRQRRQPETAANRQKTWRSPEVADDLTEQGDMTSCTNFTDHVMPVPISLIT